jgi:hypothetical protein
MFAALNHPNGKAYFFGIGGYQRYNYTTSSVERTGRTGIDGWVGVWPSYISAINHPNGKAYFFYNQGTSSFYQRFDFSIDNGLGGAVDKVGRLGVDGWVGLRTNDRATAAILHPNGKGYFFYGDNRYQQFNFSIDNGLGGAVDMEGTVGVDRWIGLWQPSHFAPFLNLVAAIVHPNGKAYFFYDNGRYQQFNFSIDNGLGGAVDMEGDISSSMWHEVTV